MASSNIKSIPIEEYCYRQARNFRQTSKASTMAFLCPYCELDFNIDSILTTREISDHFNVCKCRGVIIQNDHNVLTKKRKLDSISKSIDDNPSYLLSKVTNLQSSVKKLEIERDNISNKLDCTLRELNITKASELKMMNDIIIKDGIISDQKKQIDDQVKQNDDYNKICLENAAHAREIAIKNDTILEQKVKIDKLITTPTYNNCTFNTLNQKTQSVIINRDENGYIPFKNILKEILCNHYNTDNYTGLVGAIKFIKDVKSFINDSADNKMIKILKELTGESKSIDYINDIDNKEVENHNNSRKTEILDILETKLTENLTTDEVDTLGVMIKEAGGILML